MKVVDSWKTWRNHRGRPRNGPYGFSEILFDGLSQSGVCRSPLERSRLSLSPHWIRFLHEFDTRSRHNYGFGCQKKSIFFSFYQFRARRRNVWICPILVDSPGNDAGGPVRFVERRFAVVAFGFRTRQFSPQKQTTDLVTCSIMAVQRFSVFVFDCVAIGRSLDGGPIDIRWSTIL